jgi:exodeoxyribonuclease III
MLKVATFNVNSLRMRLPIVQGWLQKESPDVLCFQETKVQDQDFPAEAFAQLGYHITFRGQKAYAGVAIATRLPPSDVRFGLDDGEEPDEARLIQLTVQGVSIVNTYVPQGQSIDLPQFQYKLRWLNRLRQHFERHASPLKPLIWLGDLNVAPEPIDVHDPQGNAKHVAFHPDVRNALQNVRDWGFVDILRKYHPEPGQFTYWDYRIPSSLDRNLGWRVDHIWATHTLAGRSKNAWIDVGPRRAEKPSDHTVVVAEFSV